MVWQKKEEEEKTIVSSSTTTTTAAATTKINRNSAKVEWKKGSPLPIVK